MQERDVAVAILQNEKGEIAFQKKDLLYRFWPGYWALFGGEIKEGEQPDQTIKRELKEEIGCDVPDLKPIFVYEYKEKERFGKMHVFVVQFKRPLSDISINEGAGFAFFDKSELLDLKIIDNDRAVVNRFLSQL